MSVKVANYCWNIDLSHHQTTLFVNKSSATGKNNQLAKLMKRPLLFWMRVGLHIMAPLTREIMIRNASSVDVECMFSTMDFTWYSTASGREWALKGRKDFVSFMTKFLISLYFKLKTLPPSRHTCRTLWTFRLYFHAMFIDVNERVSFVDCA
jgi:hypothetical protein